MSLYNMLFGSGNPEVNKILGSVLDLDIAGGQHDTGRFRSIYAEEVDGNLQIVLHTRNGGGNRECWSDGGEDVCDCAGCVITEHLPNHPNYMHDEDDDFDCTYANIFFSVPEKYNEIVRECISDEPTPAEKWKILFEDLAN